VPTYQVERRKKGVFGWFFLIVFWIFNLIMLTSCVAGMSGASSTVASANSDAEQAGAAIGSALGLGMILSIWAAGALILGLFVLFTRGQKIIETIEKP
jgi:beta-lactamase regulating signal transducer with metallopeptidase domain